MNLVFLNTLGVISQHIQPVVTESWREPNKGKFSSDKSGETVMEKSTSFSTVASFMFQLGVSGAAIRTATVCHWWSQMHRKQVV